MYSDPAYSVSGVRAWFSEWGPPILLAIAILVAAYVIGKALKWGLANGINRIPGFGQVNQGADRRHTVGARLGEVGFWLVLLIGVVAALNVLQLGSVVTPLNTMLVEVGEFIPHLIGALVLFFLGYILATIAKRLVVAAAEAVDLDTWLERAGLRRLTGASGIASALGTLVFVLILIPFAIAALDALQVEAISTPAVAVLAAILNAIPKILTAAAILAIAFIIARWAAGLIEQLLPSFGFDNSIRALTSIGGGARGAPAEAERYSTATSDYATPPAEYTSSEYAPGAMGTDAYGATSPTGDTTVPGQPEAQPPGGAPALPAFTPSKVVANLVFAAIMIAAAVQAAHSLEFTALSEILSEILALGGQVIFGGVIIAAGVIIANVLSALIDRSTNNADGIASDIVRWATIALAVAMGLRFMGIADDIVVLAFGLILGSAAVAFGVGGAIAFGLGGREQASRWLDRLSRKADRNQG